MLLLHWHKWGQRLLHQILVKDNWKSPVIRKSYYDVFPDLHWRVQDIMNANIHAGLNIKEMAELFALDASFWHTYDELKTKDEIEGINDWKHNSMAAIPARISIISQK